MQPVQTETERRRCETEVINCYKMDPGMYAVCMITFIMYWSKHIDTAYTQLIPNFVT